jgi:hypothetical protein
MDFHKTVYEHQNSKGHLTSSIFNFIPSIILNTEIVWIYGMENTLPSPNTRS